MAYYFFLDKMQLPVPPAELEIRVNGRNKTVELINDGEINIIKTPGLTEVSFEFLIPNNKYPFANYNSGGVIGKTAILDYLERLKTSEEPFQFIVARMNSALELLHSTNLKVTLENYTMSETAELGLDMLVSVELKQYREYSTKILTVDSAGNATVVRTRGK